MGSNWQNYTPQYASFYIYVPGGWIYNNACLTMTLLNNGFCFEVICVPVQEQKDFVFKMK